MNDINDTTGDIHLLLGWIDELTARSLLDRRSTTRWKLRMKRKLVPSRISSKVYNVFDPIAELRDENSSDNFKFKKNGS